MNHLLQIPQDKPINEQIAFTKGMIEGLFAFAWMKDGTYYVGTCGTTLKETVNRIKEDFKNTTGQALE